MKCPRCTFVTSNKKDICPRCEFDLRAKKRELSLPVLRPNAPLDQLIAEHRAQQGQSAKPVSTPVVSVPEKTREKLWKKLFNLQKKTDANTFDSPTAVTPQVLVGTPAPVKPAPIAAVEVLPPKETAQEQPPTAPMQLAAKTKIDSGADALFSRLDALESEISNPISSEHLEDGLEFRLSDEHTIASFSPTEARANEHATAMLASMPVSDAPLPMSSASISASTEAETDFQELLRALEELGTDDTDQDKTSDNLFAHRVPEIDSGLDDIMQALDDITPSSELDDIELFQNKLSDLASSMQSGVDEAKTATYSLSDGPFPDSLSDEPAVAAQLPNTDESSETPNAFPEELYEPSTEVDEFEFTHTQTEELPGEELESLTSALDELDALHVTEGDSISTPEQEAATSPESSQVSAAPVVSPEVIEFGGSDEEFHKTLDEMIGDDILNVEAVKVTKKQAPPQNTTPSLVTDDGMEISFEFDLEGGGTIEATEEAIHEAEEHDPILAELLSTYEVMEQNIEHRSIAPKGVSFAETEETGPEHENLPHSVMAEEMQKNSTPPNARAQQLLEKLSFLSDDLLGELKTLLLRPPSAPLSKGETAEIPETSASPYGTLNFEVAERFKDIVREAHTSHSAHDLEQLQAQLGDELKALENEGLSIYSDAEKSEPSPAQFEASSPTPPEQTDLSALANELDSELAALESDGFSVFSSEETNEVLAHSEVEAPPTEPELDHLAHELDQELEALESEGFTVYENESVEDATKNSGDLTHLAEELDQELDALEAEGFTVYEDESHEDPMSASPELENLAEELEHELEALESEGFTVYENEAVEYTSPAASEIEHLASDLDEELASLEAEGFTVYEAEAKAESAQGREPEEYFAEVTEEEFDALTSESANDDWSAPDEQPSEAAHHLAEELEHELEALGAEGSTFVDEQPEISVVSTEEVETSFAVAQVELISELRALEEATLSVKQDSHVHAPREEDVPGNETDSYDSDDLGLEAIIGSEPPLGEADKSSEYEELFPGHVLGNFSSEDISALDTAVTNDAWAAESSDPESDLESEVASELPVEASPLGDEISRTGQFLAQDLVRLVDLVAEEKSEPSEASHVSTPTSPVAPVQAEEIDLADLAKLFNTNFGAEDLSKGSKNEPLDGALSTGVFLASDLQRIIAEGSEQNLKPTRTAVTVEDQIWESAYAEVQQAQCTNEVELGITELAPLHQNDALNVLFDLAEAELRDPNGIRHKVTDISSNVKADVENRSLQQALTVFEKEEKIISRRRARPANVVAAEARKTVQIVPAGWVRRSVAAGIDVVASVATSAVCMWFAVLPERLKHQLVSSSFEVSYILLPYGFQLIGLSYLMWLVALTVFTSGWGQTFGAQLLGIETIDGDGHVPGLKQSMLRALSTTTALLPFGLGFLPLLGKSGRAVHDRMSNTYVRLKKP